MKFSETRIDGAVRVDIEPHCDERGYFARTYCVDEFSAAGIAKPLIQNSISHSRSSGTLRGLHYHATEFPQTRLIRCIRGSLFAVIVDIREASPSYLANVTMDLSEQNHVALFVPSGVTLGYQTLEDATTVYYQMSELYEPEYDRGVRWNDSAFGISWPDADRIINERDAGYPDYEAGGNYDA